MYVGSTTSVMRAYGRHREEHVVAEPSVARRLRQALSVDWVVNPTQPYVTDHLISRRSSRPQARTRVAARSLGGGPSIERDRPPPSKKWTKTERDEQSRGWETSVTANETVAGSRRVAKGSARPNRAPASRRREAEVAARYLTDLTSPRVLHETPSSERSVRPGARRGWAGRLHAHGCARYAGIGPDRPPGPRQTRPSYPSAGRAVAVASRRAPERGHVPARPAVTR